MKCTILLMALLMTGCIITKGQVKTNPVEKTHKRSVRRSNIQEPKKSPPQETTSPSTSTMSAYDCMKAVKAELRQTPLEEGQKRTISVCGDQIVCKKVGGEINCKGAKMEMQLTDL